MDDCYAPKRKQTYLLLTSCSVSINDKFVTLMYADLTVVTDRWEESNCRCMVYSQIVPCTLAILTIYLGEVKTQYEILEWKVSIMSII